MLKLWRSGIINIIVCNNSSRVRNTIVFAFLHNDKHVCDCRVPLSFTGTATVWRCTPSTPF